MYVVIVLPSARGFPTTRLLTNNENTDLNKYIFKNLIRMIEIYKLQSMERQMLLQKQNMKV